jgi:dTDP-4-amino-4,6-dideoxy-D-galactose acyltransferase
MISDLIEFRKSILYEYSQYSFLPKLDKDKVFLSSVKNKILDLERMSDVEFVQIDISGFRHVFIIKFLPWDTDYFKIKTYRLMFVLYEHSDYDILKLAMKKFADQVLNKRRCYCFSEIPSEDIKTIQALNESGFKLVENRLTYYLDLKTHEFERYNVRSATIDDIDNLKRVARLMRNDYDRFHAETIFNSSLADEFLATFIEESIKGFSDCVIVPNEFKVPPDAFLTANYLFEEWDKIGEKISKMVLSAVSSEHCKGWYIKLISEMAYHLKERGANYAFMHPATTNKAVIHSYEKLGCKYGKCVHVLTYSSL